MIEIKTDKSVNENSVLYQNNPNPFNYKTTFNYKIGLEIYDQYENFITSFFNENQTARNYTIDWNALNIAPGVYFYSLKVNGIIWV